MYKRDKQRKPYTLPYLFFILNSPQGPQAHWRWQCLWPQDGSWAWLSRGLMCEGQIATWPAPPPTRTAAPAWRTTAWSHRCLVARTSQSQLPLRTRRGPAAHLRPRSSSPVRIAERPSSRSLQCGVGDTHVQCAHKNANTQINIY